MPPVENKFTFWVAVCFTLNYIVGTGFLTLPWAFHQAGFVLGFILVAIITVFALLAVLYILEAMARAEALNLLLAYSTPLTPNLSAIKSPKKNISFQKIRSYQSIEAPQADDNSLNPMRKIAEGEDYALSYVIDAESASSPDRLHQPPSSYTESSSTALLPKEFKQSNPWLVGNLLFGTSELCEIFLGPTGGLAYTIMISTYGYTTLWAYSTVFAQTLAAHADIGLHSYILYLFLFSCIVVPVSLMELSEQISMQVVLSLCRVLMVVCMLGTIIFAESESYPSFGEFQPSQHSSADLFNPSKMYLLLPVAAYANIFHQSIPDLSHPVEDKSKLFGIFTTALTISVLAYCSMGIVIASYFGPEIKVASNINWIAYHGHRLANGMAPWHAKLISQFVVLFPAIDVASAFPLNAITLGNNLMGFYYGHDNIHDQESSRWVRTLFRLLAALPPILAASLVSDLGKVTDFAGVTGFANAFIFPALLAYFSEKEFKSRGLSPTTAYSVKGLSTGSQILTAALGAFLIVFVVSCLLLAGSHGGRRFI